ncbi:MAG TPA: chloride channel protein [Gammaproteobacteria bacterium]|jgi:H+/Cl- antiporter ClcA|nr:chloride channel protein [Gammaproteobacteria bacterium]
MPKRLHSYLSLSAWKTRIVFWGGAVAVGGIAAGFAAIGNNAMSLQAGLVSKSAFWPLIATPAGFVVIAWLTRKVFPGTQGSGIPQAVAALQTHETSLRRRVLSVRIAIGKIILTLLGLLSGASIGREGPTVHVGASMMYSLGRWAKFPVHFIDRGLILAGSAAGITAAFNTPFAGIMFAIEEMARSFEERNSGTIFVAVILAGVIALAILGNYTYFGTTNVFLPNPDAWLAIPVCGVVGGLAGGAFSRLLLLSMGKLAGWARRRPYIVAAACGLALAILGLVSGSATYGSGYTQAREILLGQNHAGFGFPFYKIAANMVSYLSGIPGGLFSPALSAGAGVGADIAPLLPATPGSAVVLLGMVAYFTGVVQTPITGAIIVTEMVDDNAMMLPIMATAFIALGASRLICRTPIYLALAQEFIPARQPAPAAEGAEQETA